MKKWIAIKIIIVNLLFICLYVKHYFKCGFYLSKVNKKDKSTAINCEKIVSKIIVIGKNI